MLIMFHVEQQELVVQPNVSNHRRRKSEGWCG
jgi:hypothetical protein